MYSTLPACTPRRRAARIAATLVAGLALAGSSMAAQPESQEWTSPDWTATDIGGDAISLSALSRDRPVVLFFWASWCPYCKALMPHLQSIRFEYGPGVEILALHFRDEADPAEFMADSGFDFRIVPKAGRLAGHYRIHGTPGLLIIDRNRVVRFDLRRVPRPGAGTGSSKGTGHDGNSHRARAARAAPYWAAALRRAIDATLADYPAESDTSSR